jgi:hypothetical protein
MSVPDDLEDWTYETIVYIVNNLDSEPAWCDFKGLLNPTGSEKGKADYTATIRKTAGSMANGDGGFILFGVKDLQTEAAKPEDRIVGIPASSELRRDFGRLLSTMQRPFRCEVKSLALPNEPSKCVFVAYIPTSDLRPHMDTSAGAFYIRGDGGSARRMDFLEVRDEMLYTEGRLQKVTLLRFELATIFEVSKMLRNWTTSSVRFDVSAYKVLLADTCDLYQADSELLPMLHRIGSIATILNPLLDSFQSMPPYDTSSNYANGQRRAELEQEITRRRGKLFNDCGLAQDCLSRLFGPLNITQVTGDDW